MKTIGLLGGMSWESTLLYYRIINRRVGERLGGLHSAALVLYSVDFAEVERLQHEDRWEEAGDLLSAAAVALQTAGAELLLLCTNTMHRVAPAIEASLRIPFLHIADPTARALREAGVSTVGLLGTRFTMEQDFYRARLEERFGLGVRVPGPKARALVHEVIYEELCRGVVSERSRAGFCGVVGELADEGAQAIVLGCTEIALLLRPEDASLPLFDTTLLHAEAAVDAALDGSALGAGARSAP